MNARGVGSRFPNQMGSGRRLNLAAQARGSPWATPEGGGRMRKVPAGSILEQISNHKQEVRQSPSKVKILVMREGQELLPGPDMIGQPNGHRRRPRPIPPPLRQTLPRFPQGPMGPQPVRLKPTEDHPRLPGLYHPGKGMGLTRPRIQPIAPHAIPSFLMHRIGAIHRLSHNQTHFHAHHPALMTTLDRLRQPHPGRGRQGRTPPLSRGRRVPIDLTNRPSVDRPSIADPDHAPPARCALAGLRHHLRRDLILRRPKAPRHPKTSRPVRTPTSPTRAHPARRGGRISSLRRLFWTNDQKASTSTSLRCRSWTRTSVRASACRAAARRHRRIVSTLWPVIASAALRLPRRITTNRVRATSVGVARQRSITVPRVGPNERPQFRQTQRGRPPLLPFFTTWVAPQRGQGGSGNWAFDSSGPPPSESGPDDTTEHYSGG
jgi:hypothetical protein